MSRLDELADKIHKHLLRIFEDPVLNPYRDGRRNFYYPGARRAGAYVSVWTVSYMGKDMLRRPEAETYLAWLEAGNVGSPLSMRSDCLKGGADG